MSCMQLNPLQNVMPNSLIKNNQKFHIEWQYLIDSYIKYFAVKTIRLIIYYGMPNSFVKWIQQVVINTPNQLPHAQANIWLAK